ncbi:MAG: PQQ-binding-like beta-propeller repeat protein [Candidatus Aegiribacteria sp.]
MHKAETHSEEGIGSRAHGDTRKATLIGVSLMGALIALFLLSTVFNSGRGGEDPAPTLQAVSEDSSGTDSLPEAAVPVLIEAKPRFWLQARASSTGDAGWGADAAAPFQNLWELESSLGREFFSSPALVDDVLYFGCNDGNMRAVNAASGSVLWSFSTVCGICGEPAVDSTTVYFGGQDGYVYALDRATGRRRWSSGLGFHIFCDTGILCDSLILSGNSMGKVCALDSRTGQPVWDREIGGTVLGPAVVDTLAIYTSESGVTAVFDYRGESLWTAEHANQASAPSADSTAVFVAYSGGMVRKFDIGSGRLLWDTDVVSRPGRTVLARPVLTGGKVLVGTNDGQLVCLNRETGGIIWEQQFDNWLQLPPAVGQELVYLACDDQRLHLVELETGVKVDSLEMGGYSGTAPLLMDGVVFYGNTSGVFTAVRGTPPPLEETIPEDTLSAGTEAAPDTLETAPPDNMPEDPEPEAVETVQPLPENGDPTAPPEETDAAE